MLGNFNSGWCDPAH